MSHENRIRLIYDARAVFWIFLALQVSIGGLLLRRYPAKRGFPGGVAKLTGLTSASLIGASVADFLFSR
jgi:hypothetical protein